MSSKRFNVRQVFARPEKKQRLTEEKQRPTRLSHERWLQCKKMQAARDIRDEALRRFLDVNMLDFNQRVVDSMLYEKPGGDWLRRQFLPVCFTAFDGTSYQELKVISRICGMDIEADLEKLCLAKHNEDYQILLNRLSTSETRLFQYLLLDLESFQRIEYSGDGRYGDWEVLSHGHEMFDILWLLKFHGFRLYSPLNRSDYKLLDDYEFRTVYKKEEDEIKGSRQAWPSFSSDLPADCITTSMIRSQAHEDQLLSDLEARNFPNHPVPFTYKVLMAQRNAEKRALLKKQRDEAKTKTFF